MGICAQRMGSEFPWKITCLKKNSGSASPAGCARTACGLSPAWSWAPSASAAGSGGMPHIDKVNGDASAKYEQMTADLSKGDRTGALILLADLERDFSSTPYVDQARLAFDRVYVEGNELDKAATELQAVSQHLEGHATRPDRATAPVTGADLAAEARRRTYDFGRRRSGRLRSSLSRSSRRR